MPQLTNVSLPSASEFLDFAKRGKVNLDVTASALLEAADPILRHRPGYVLFNIRCGLLIIDRPVIEIDFEQFANLQKG